MGLLILCIQTASPFELPLPCFSFRVPAHVKVNPSKFDCSCTIPYEPYYADCCAPEVRPPCAVEHVARLCTSVHYSTRLNTTVRSRVGRWPSLVLLSYLGG